MSDYPIFPPGFRRCIVLEAARQTICAGLEDDAHRFTLRITHADGVIVDADARTERGPWSTCSGASPFIAKALIGRRLADVGLPDATQHCTHLHDLAIIAAAHAFDGQPLRIDMQVADRVNGRSTATLMENDEIRLTWQISGTTIDGPAPWAGLDLRRLGDLQAELSPADMLRARMLRRAVFVSGARQVEDRSLGTAADRPQRLGVCYTYQMPRAADAVQFEGWRRDFSAGTIEPLAGFAPDALAEGRRSAAFSGLDGPGGSSSAELGMFIY